MKEIRLVVTDLDDTLLGPDKEISPELMPVLAELAQRGIPFTFVTGRPEYAVRRFARRIGLQAPMVTCNGAIVCDEQGGVLARESFPIAPLRPLLTRGAELGYTVLVYTEDVEYALSHTAWTRSREEEGRPIPQRTFTANEWECLRADKVNVIRNGATQPFQAFHDEIRLLRQAYAIALYGGEGCEIVAKGVNKATGLQKLCDHLGVTLDQALAVGDNENDVEMLREAGVGAAVANASAGARDSADYLCRQSYTAGVIEAIRTFVLTKEARV